MCEANDIAQLPITTGQGTIYNGCLPCTELRRSIANVRGRGRGDVRVSVECIGRMAECGLLPHGSDGGQLRSSRLGRGRGSPLQAAMRPRPPIQIRPFSLWPSRFTRSLHVKEQDGGLMGEHTGKSSLRLLPQAWFIATGFSSRRRRAGKASRPARWRSHWRGRWALTHPPHQPWPPPRRPISSRF